MRVNKWIKAQRAQLWTGRAHSTPERLQRILHSGMQVLAILACSVFQDSSLCFYSNILIFIVLKLKKSLADKKKTFLWARFRWVWSGDWSHFTTSTLQYQIHEQRSCAFLNISITSVWLMRRYAIDGIDWKNRGERFDSSMGLYSCYLKDCCKLEGSLFEGMALSSLGSLCSTVQVTKLMIL